MSPEDGQWAENLDLLDRLSTPPAGSDSGANKPALSPIKVYFLPFDMCRGAYVVSGFHLDLNASEGRRWQACIPIYRVLAIDCLADGRGVDAGTAQRSGFSRFRGINRYEIRG